MKQFPVITVILQYMLLGISVNLDAQDSALFLSPEATDEVVLDYDGNLYNSVTIGTQTWLKENLKTTKYNDGTSVPLVTDNTAWSNLSTPGYCWYNNDIFFKNPYGALYNWYAVNTGKLCPAGWHVSTYSDWYTLETYLGGSDVAGGKLKEAGTTHWKSPNTGATNESGFTGLPGSWRANSGYFGSQYYEGGSYWGSGSNTGSTYAEIWNLFYLNATVSIVSQYKKAGFSVRCVKDLATNNPGAKYISEPGKLHLFPDPASDVLNVQFSCPSDQQIVIEILTLEGKVLYKQLITGIESVNPVNVSFLKTNLYICRITVEGTINIAKFIKL
jgi:uncharacterized protein (TIGR02145 family)